MSTAFLQLTLLKLKPDAHLDEVGSPAGDALLDVISVVKKADSKNRAFFGHQLENPDIGVLAFRELQLTVSFPPGLWLFYSIKVLIHGTKSTRQRKAHKSSLPLPRPSLRRSAHLLRPGRSSSPPQTG